MDNTAKMNDIGFTGVDKARQEMLEKGCAVCGKEGVIGICWECEKGDILDHTKDITAKIL